MKDAKLETNVYCDVCCCVHNVKGKLCEREGIKITVDPDNEQAHFCKSFECKNK